MYDLTLLALAVNTTAPSDEDISDGADALLLMSVTSGIALPYSDPSHMGRPIVVPVAQVRFRLDGDACIAIGTEMVTCGNRMPRPSGLEIVRDLSDAERAAANLRNFRTG